VTQLEFVFGSKLPFIPPAPWEIYRLLKVMHHVREAAVKAMWVLMS